MGIVYSKTF